MLRTTYYLVKMVREKYIKIFRYYFMVFAKWITIFMLSHLSQRWRLCRNFFSAAFILTLPCCVVLLLLIMLMLLFVLLLFFLLFDKVLRFIMRKSKFYAFENLLNCLFIHVWFLSLCLCYADHQFEMPRISFFLLHQMNFDFLFEKGQKAWGPIFLTRF